MPSPDAADAGTRHVGHRGTFPHNCGCRLPGVTLPATPAGWTAFLRLTALYLLPRLLHLPAAVDTARLPSPLPTRYATRPPRTYTHHSTHTTRCAAGRAPPALPQPATLPRAPPATHTFPPRCPLQQTPAPCCPCTPACPPFRPRLSQLRALLLSSSCWTLHVAVAFSIRHLPGRRKFSLVNGFLPCRWCPPWGWWAWRDPPPAPLGTVARWAGGHASGWRVHCFCCSRTALRYTPPSPSLFSAMIVVGPDLEQ